MPKGIYKRKQQLGFVSETQKRILKSELCGNGCGRVISKTNMLKHLKVCKNAKAPSKLKKKDKKEREAAKALKKQEAARKKEKKMQEKSERARVRSLKREETNKELLKAGERLNYWVYMKKTRYAPARKIRGAIYDAHPRVVASSLKFQRLVIAYVMRQYYCRFYGRKGEEKAPKTKASLVRDPVILRKDQVWKRKVLKKPELPHWMLGRWFSGYKKRTIDRARRRYKLDTQADASRKMCYKHSCFYYPRVWSYYSVFYPLKECSECRWEKEAISETLKYGGTVSD